MEETPRQEVLAEEAVFFEKKSNGIQWLGWAVLWGNGAWKDWPRQGCLEEGRVWFRRSKILGNGNRGHMGTWLGCPGSLVWLRQETCWKKKCLGGEKMKNFSPVGFQCSKFVSTFSIYQLKAMMIWPRDCLKLVSGNWRNNSLTDAGGWAVLHVSLFTACAVEEVKVQSLLLACCCISHELYIEGYGLCSWTLLLPLCSFLSWCFPLSRRSAGGDRHSTCVRLISAHLTCIWV